MTTDHWSIIVRLVDQWRMDSFNCVSNVTMGWFVKWKDGRSQNSYSNRRLRGEKISRQRRIFSICFVQLHWQLCGQEWILQKMVKNWLWPATFGRLFVGERALTTIQRFVRLLFFVQEGAWACGWAAWGLDWAAKDKAGHSPLTLGPAEGVGRVGGWHISCCHKFIRL